MNRKLAIALITIVAFAGFFAGLLVEHGHIRNTVVPVPANPADAQGPGLECDHAPDGDWRTARLDWYMPRRTLYNVEWQICSVEDQRVRVTDSNFSTTFFSYSDDQIYRVEELALLGDDQMPELLVVTGGAGTDDRITWHIIDEANDGTLREWKTPDYDAAAERLLGPGEDFCCKSWDFHLQGNDIVLARGIYDKGVDPNCCPSRGGVLVRLEPVRGALELANTQRIGKSEYDHWRSQPFCLHCALVSR